MVSALAATVVGKPAQVYVHGRGVLQGGRPLVRTHSHWIDVLGVSRAGSGR